ncbi:metallophosphoesterase [Paenibacillus lycopersici]|uniref:Metallophosphoesterase n=1 Tax=Paenibacillus lycopersici TaxID=2704462 RepID=A0A6C0FVB8_9BACL|nr:metallophosphoesterase [Paenibacillus lycopersici]QHT59353.1 metallophosphoesterase [Paenibacillus lycopersici]
MKIGILQLSDIHMAIEENSVLTKHEKIHSAIQEYIFEIDHLFLMVTGDSAYSGQYEEYIKTIEMLEGISSNISRVKKIGISFIIIPGNHDCDFKAGKPPIRDMVINNIQNGKVSSFDEYIIDELLAPQEQYINYLQYFEPTENKIYDNKLFKSYLFNLGSFNIIFNCFNSSWISMLKEKPGSLYFPIEKFKEYLSLSKGDLVISTIHHPLNWYFPENSRVIGETLEACSDFILTGHEHVSTASKVEDFSGNITQYIEGGVLQESNTPVVSQFNLLIFNLASKHQKFVRYSWNESYYSNVFETDWVAYQRFVSLNKSVFVLSNEFNSYLNDPGITIRHPRKPIVSLEDIYLYPDARLVEINEKAGKVDQIVNLQKVTSSSEDIKLFIFGSERSGKTAFCKTIYRHYHNNGLVPVYINALEIKSNTLSDFNKVVYKNYIYQYSDSTLERYKQLEHFKKIIIIDDLEKSKLNSKSVSELISNIMVMYPNLILTGNEMMKYSDLIEDEKDEEDFLDKFEKFEILQFGHLKRSQLVNKWNSLGQVINISEAELMEKHDKMIADINIVIGNNFVPSFPFFLLILLQTAESGMPHNNKDSAYGYYYELLITQSFININMQHKEIDAYYTYISELAYYFFDKDIYEFSYFEFEQFNGGICQKYDLTNDFERTLKRLINSSIIESRNNSYSFKYSYIYYYFVAKYFSVKITEEKIRDKIAEMCSNVHIEEYANILMFLTHLSKDPFILYEIHKQAQKIFDECSPTTLENDIVALNNLAIELPKIVYHNIEVKKHREEQLIAKDEMERGHQQVAVTKREQDASRNSAMDVAAKLNVAFKTIEILGQILRNYYGSIEATEKYFLAEESYMVGLRTLNSFLSVISDNVNNIANKIQKFIEQQEGDHNKAEIQKKAGKLLFNLCCAISYHTIIKVSESIGSKDLYSTYQKITEQHNSVAVRLIEISIKLDQSRSLPYNDIKALKEYTSDNVLATSLLKVLVINHLYMFDTDRIEKQKICSLLDIPMSKQLAIDLVSTQKKDR